MTNLHRNIKAKGWKLQDVAKRWGISPRQMSNRSKNPSTKDFDAVEGLPDKSKDTK